jgi:SAM-dependent methyltransferase
MMIETLAAPSPAVRSKAVSRAGFEALALRERVSERYWSERDPINATRSWWRAQTVRHLFHLLPGESILELGCGSGQLTRALVRATRGQCPITAATFALSTDGEALPSAGAVVEVVKLTDFPGVLRGRQFDYIVASNLLDSANAAAVLREIFDLLRPGGRLLFFETNPWNPVFQLRRRLCGWLRFLRRGDEHRLPNQVQLYELVSELGFVRIATTSYDFLYRPIPRWLMMIARNLSLVLENTPGLRQLAGIILVHAQRPPRDLPRPPVHLVEHPELQDAVSVIVPCHNEEMNVQPLVEGLLQFYGAYIHELIFVDDNSTDGTRQMLERLALQDLRIRPIFRQPPNGVGRALRDGMRQATGKYVFLMDCDFLHLLPELREMFDAAVQGYDAVLGSRFSRESVLINYPLRKILFNRTFHVLVNFLFHCRVRDVTNNLKLLKREVVDNLELEEPWFAANAETGLKPLLMGYRIREIPISWINRTPEMGQSSFSLLQSGWGYIRVLLVLAWRSRCGFHRLAASAAQNRLSGREALGRSR